MLILRCNRVCLAVLVSFLCGSIVLVADAASIRIDPPNSGAYIVDHAELLFATDEENIGALCETLLSEQQIPLVVVTIESMGASGMKRGTVEAFARKLFEQWGRDPRFVYRESWRRGILLLVSKGDRKARIELGAAWAGQYDEQSQRVMDQLIIPEFKQGFYAGGISRGVSGLLAMSRGKELPAPPSELWGILNEMSKVVVAIFLMVTVPLVVIAISEWVDRKSDPEGYAARMEARRLKEAKAARERKRRRKRRDERYDDDYESSSSSGSDFGGGGGATGSW